MAQYEPKILQSVKNNNLYFCVSEAIINSIDLGQCCYGYMVDLLKNLTSKNKINLTLSISSAKGYGRFFYNSKGIVVVNKYISY